MRTRSTEAFQKFHPEWQHALREIAYHPIGYVETEFDHAFPKALLEACNESRILLHPDYEEGLLGLVIGRRLRVFYHHHRSAGYKLLQHPHGNQSLPQRGLFGIESPDRPNPVDFSDVDLLAMGDHVIWVKGLNAVNGSPVLDIQPVPKRIGRGVYLS